MRIWHIDYTERWMLPFAQFFQAMFPCFIIKYTHDKGIEKLTHYISEYEVLTKQAYLRTYKDTLAIDAFNTYRRELGLGFRYYFQHNKSGTSLIMRRDKLKLPTVLYFELHKRKIKHEVHRFLYKLIASWNKDFEFVYIEDFKSANFFIQDGIVYCLDFDNIFVRKNDKIIKLENA